jgi:hypothetical protein
MILLLIPHTSEEGEGREQIKGESMRSILKLPVSFLFLVLAASAGLAQQRTFVSGSGVDNPSCSLAAPCRTFAHAISVNSAGGEVVALDAAQYDPFTISEAISIIAPFGAGISVPPGGDGIIVNPVSGNVVLRGLTINSQGSGSFGILANSVGALHIEDCVVNGFDASSTAAGVQFKGSGKLLVKDTVARVITRALK